MFITRISRYYSEIKRERERESLKLGEREKAVYLKIVLIE